jgi:hypothetical protein
MPRRNRKEPAKTAPATAPALAKSESQELDEDLARLEVRCSPKLLHTSPRGSQIYGCISAGCSQAENAEMEAKLKLSSRESYRAAEPPSLATSDSANLDEDIARLEVRPRQ